MQRRQVGNDRFVGNNIVAVIDRAVDRGLDALFKISDQIARVAAENFVSTLPAQNDLPMFGCELRNHVLRKRSWPGNRIVEVIDDLANIVDEV